MNKQHFAMMLSAERAGYRLLDSSAWPDMIVQHRSDEPPLFVKNIYTGRGRNPSETFHFRTLQILQDLGLEVRICYNGDMTKLIPLDKLIARETVFPNLPRAENTIITKKSLYRRALRELREFTPESSEYAKLVNDLTKLKQVLVEEHAFGGMEDFEAVVTQTETQDQRAARFRAEAITEMKQHLVQTDPMHPALKGLLDEEDSALIVNEMQAADQRAQDVYERSLLEKEGGEKS